MPRVIRLSLLAVLLFEAQVVAFEPAGPPPQWTQASTVAFLNRTVIPSVYYDKAPLGEAVEFIRLYRPPGHQPELMLDRTLQNAAAHISIQEQDITLMDLLARIADQAHADIVISSGKVILRSSEAR